MSSVKGVTERCWILALFVRSDGERFLLGDGMYEFTAEQQHFAPNDIENTLVEVQGGDGSMLGGQARRASVQAFDGYVGCGSNSKVEIETARRAFISFFQTNFFYEVIYVFPDGSAIKRNRGFLVDAPSVQELWQIHPTYHVGLSFEDVNYYSYLEDAEGNEIYGMKASVYAANGIVGGLVWDDKGTVWDQVGAVWEGGANGNTIIQNNSQSNIYPIWTIVGPSAEPELRNLSTGESLKFTRKGDSTWGPDIVITSNQKLVVDMLQHTAKLYDEGETGFTNMLPYLKGTWMAFKPGRNELAYLSDNLLSPPSTVEWAEVVA